MSSQDAHLARDFVGYGPTPPDPKWPNGARLALNIGIAFEEGGELSVPDGAKSSELGLTDGAPTGFGGRDLAAESMFEYGSRVGIWRVLRMLRERKFTSTFYACALALERNPLVCAAIKESNYDVCAHGWQWELHHGLTEEEERDRIRRTVASITKTIDVRPAGWLCRYGPGLNTRRLVVEEGGFTYDSDSYNDDLPFWVKVSGKQHLVVPYGLINNDVKFIRGSLATGEDFYTYLRDAFDILYGEGATHPKMMSVGIHMRLVGQAGRARGLEKFLDHVAAHKDVWVCRRIDIAQHWMKTHPAPQ